LREESCQRNAFGPDSVGFCPKRLFSIAPHSQWGASEGSCIMAIKAKKYKSTEKKVNKAKVTQLGGRLNRAARSISRAEAIDLTPGVDAIRDPSKRGSSNASKKRQERLIEIRRRRH
jgi:hypothetical protein